MPLCLVWIFLRMKPKVRFAFVVTFCICWFQFRSWPISSPRYFAWSTASKTWPCSTYWIWWGFRARVICRTWHLLGLKCISQSSTFQVFEGPAAGSVNHLCWWRSNIRQCHQQKVWPVNLCFQESTCYQETVGLASLHEDPERSPVNIIGPVIWLLFEKKPSSNRTTPFRMEKRKPVPPMIQKRWQNRTVKL